MGRAARWAGVAAVAVLALSAGRAGAATYYGIADNTTNLGPETCNLPSANTASGPGWRTTTQTTAPAGTSTQMRSPATSTAGTWYLFGRFFGPVYASAQAITAPSATLYLRCSVANTGDQFQVFLKAYDPAGAAGNGTTLYTSNVVTGCTTTATATTFTFTGSGSVPANDRLFLEVAYRPAAANGVGRVYLAATANNSSFTVTEAAAGTPPSAPGNPTYTGVGPTGLTVNWTASATGTAPITYTVDQGSSSTGPWTNVAGCVGVSATTCAIASGLTQNTTYWYRVTATNSAGSAASGSTSQLTLPAAPAMAAYTNVAGTSVTANWTMGAPTTGLTYTLQQGSSATGPWTTVTGCTAGALTCNVGGLTAGATYWFQVRATNTTGNGAYSASTSVQTATAPSAPGNPTYSGVGATGLTVSWTASTGTSPITYTVGQGSSATGPWTNVTGCVGIAGTTCAIASGLGSNTTYWYRVTATNSVGSATSGATSQLTQPGQAGTPTFSGTTSSGTTVAWTAPTGGAASYTLERATNAGFTTGYVSTPGLTGTSTPVSGLAATTIYYFRVTAVNAAGNGAVSGTGNVTTLAGPSAPGAPGNPTYASVTATSMTVNWTASATGSTPITYTLDQGSSATGPWTNVPGCVGVSGLTCPVSGLAQNTTYFHRVTATNSVGSTPSAAATSQLTLPAVPAMDVYTNVAATSVTVNWTMAAPTAGLTYVLQQGSSGTGPWTNVAGCAAGSLTCNVAGLTTGVTYWFHVQAVNAAGSSAFSTATSVTPSAFVAEGDATSGSTRPVVSIMNPAKGGVVKAPFKVQARIFSPGGRAVTPAPSLYVDGTAVAMTPSAQYGTTASSGVWEYQVSALAPGGHDLRVWSENGTGGVWSAVVHVTVSATGNGDGNLLVRDNSSQLCADCHSMPSHSAEATGAKYGSWSTTCRDCHDPHGTGNIALVGEQITPPALAGPQTPKTVTFYDRSGTGPNSFANASGTGPCQVCHTRTTYYRADGTGATHNPTANCASCHAHAKGLAASCTTCHGTTGRAKGATVAGAVDSVFEASPPVDTAGASTGVKVGAHLAHVNQGTYRTNALVCADCHPWPNTHQTPSQRDAAWSALASTGAPASYTVAPVEGVGAYGTTWEATPTCTNWCHGAGLPGGGGGNTAPNWTLGSTQAACGTCHASPPPVNATAAGDHPQNTACASCHGTGYAQASVGGTAKDTHVDGTIQKPANGCTACHGKLAGLAGVAVGSTSPTAAPGYDALSVDTHGSSDRLQVGVGAHVKHVNAGLMTAKTCNVCHPLPADGDTAHANGGAAQMQWSAPANVAVTPTYTSPSCTNYCHSSGDPLGAATPATAPISWVSQTALGCASCHQAAALTTNAHGAHVTKYACNNCHVDTTPDGATIVAGGGLHVNGANDVGFDASSPFVQGGSYTAPSSPTNPATCSNVYCHSGGTKRSPPYTSGPSIAWNGGATTCTSCHGGPQTSASPIASGKHPNHVNVAGTIGGAASTNFTCGTCHTSTVAVNTNSPVTGTAHVDRIASVTFDPLYGGTFTQGATEGSGGCASNYCHSSGQNPAAAPAIIQYRNVAWNDPALGCNGCHGTGNAAGGPDYASGGAGSPTANSHALHATTAADCANCHAGTVTAAGGAILATSTLHLNRSREVQISAARDTNGATSNYDTATKTCNSVSCHGTGTPQWGGAPLKCSDCHTGASDVNSFAFGTAGSISTSEWTSTGHGQAAFGFPTTAAGTPCLYCHDGSVAHDLAGNPFRLRGVTGAGGAVTAGNYGAATASSANQACLNCHATTGANGVDPDGAATANPLVTSARKVDAYHGGAKHSASATGGTRCWDCHDPHGDGTNIKMIGADVVKASTDNHSWAATRITGVAFTANVTGTDYANASATSLCRACHTATTGAAHYNATTNDGHNSGAKCVACHAHNQTPNLAFKEATACSACHGAPPTAGKHAFHDETTFAETSYANNARHASATQYGFACNTCHNGTHMNGTGPYTAQVVFGSFDTTAVGGTYTAGVAQPADTGPTGLTFNWSSGSCNATYCHSNGAPVGGTSLAAAPAWNEAAWVKTGATANECTKCHQVTADNPASPTSTRLSHSHWVHVTNVAGGGYYFNCSQCHNGVATGQSDYPATAASIVNKTLHVSGSRTVAFDATVNPGTTSYTQGTSPTNPYTCSNTYCHSNGTSAATPPANVSIPWSSATGSTCASCHGDATTLATGTHAAHVNNPTILGTSYLCGDCHQNTVAAGTSAPVTNRANHVNRAKDVAIGNRGTMVSTQPVAGGCNAVYCHSTGRPATTGSTSASKYYAVTWGQAGTLGCNACHGALASGTDADFGFVSQFGEPNYANGGQNLVNSNTHQKHVGTSAASCGSCHSGLVNATATGVLGSSHTNGTRNVVIAAAYDGNGATANYDPATKTCSGITCHGSTATEVWGGTLACNACHNAPPTAAPHGTHDEAWTQTTYTDAVNQTTATQYKIACNTCHNGTHANSTGAGTVASPYTVEVVMAAPRTYTAGATVGTETAASGAVFRYTNGTCNSVYCHSNGGPLQSTGTNAAPTYATPTWNATNVACDGCHGYGDVPGTMSAPHAKHIRANAASSYAYGCQQCHQPTTTTGTSITDKTKHADGVNDQVAFLATMNPAPAAYNTTSFTCGSTYCHSNGNPLGGTLASTSPAWTGGPMPANCTGCHGGNAGAGASAIATNKHPQHMNNAALLGTNYGCVDCHNATVSADQAILAPAGYTRHVNGGTKDVGFPNRGTMTSGAYATPTCASVYCHSTGRPATAGSATASKYYGVTWNQAGALDCKGCHGALVSGTDADFGFVSQFGEPNYANGGANLVNSNSHQRHATSAATCAVCHQQTTASGTAINGAFNLHTDGQRQVTWDATRTTAGASYTQASKTCGSTGSSCHGTGTAVWGATNVTCLSCHGTTLAETKDLGASFWNNGVAATINTTEWTYSGHGKTTGTYDVTANPAAALPTTPTAGTSECMYCHDSAVGHQDGANPFRLRGAAGANGVTAAYSTASPNATCLNCHSTGSLGVDPDGTAAPYALKNGTFKADAAHDGTKHTLATLGGKFCWDCHDPHGDRPNATTNNIAMIANSVTVTSDGTHGYVGASGLQRAVTYNTEAASPPASGKAVETTTAANAQHVGICQACHAATSDVLAAPTAWTKYWNRLGYDDPDGVGGGAPAASAHNSGSATVPYCINCHPHAKKFAGSGACTDCHTGTQLITMGPLANGTNARRAIVTEFARTWSHKRSASPTGTVSKWDCIVCHMEGDPTTGDPSGTHADGYVDLRDPDTGTQITGATWGGTGAGAYTTNSTVVRFARFSRNLASRTLEPEVTAIMINQCLKCHDSNGAGSTAARVPGAPNGGKPFNTTIAGANYTGNGITAFGSQGNVTDVNASFATTNSSYHPVLGKQNNWYAKTSRMVAPWNSATRVGTAASTNSWGDLISCWDCHALPTDTGTITGTVTAHGGTATLRGTSTSTGTSLTAANGVSLCIKCHGGYDTNTGTNHGANSAFSSSGNSGMTTYLRYGCNRCHGSSYATVAVRPVRAIDAHGVNVLPTTGTAKAAGSRWAGASVGTPAQIDARPYSFIRNTENLSNHQPARIGGSTYTPQCNMAVSPCNQGTGNYTVGGTY